MPCRSTHSFAFFACVAVTSACAGLEMRTATAPALPESLAHEREASRSAPSSETKRDDLAERPKARAMAPAPSRAGMIDLDSTELALLGAARGVSPLAARAQKALVRNLSWMDSTEGGILEPSSAAGAPEHTKLASSQATNLLLYARAMDLWHGRSYTRAARSIDHYIDRALTSADGAFFFGELPRSGDGAAPAIDTRIVPRENGMLISALVAWSRVSSDARALERAVRAAEWIVDHRALAEGGFRHDEGGEGGRSLEAGDTIEMGRAMVSLYEATGDRRWLAEAERAASFLTHTFMDGDGGFVSTRSAPSPIDPGAESSPSGPKRFDENIAIIRFASALGRHTQSSTYRRMAEHALQFVSSPETLGTSEVAAGLLLADGEYRRARAEMNARASADETALSARSH